MRTLGGLLIASVMIVVSACATTPAVPPSVNVTGKWAGSWAYDEARLGTGTLSGSFQQNGADLSGSFNVAGPVQNPVANNVIGFVSGNEIRLSQPASGTLTVKGNEITGWINGLHAAKITLRKQP